MPSFTTAPKKSKSDFKSNDNGTIAVRWQDTKEGLLLSNYDTDSMGQIKKTKRRLQKVHHLLHSYTVLPRKNGCSGQN